MLLLKLATLTIRVGLRTPHGAYRGPTTRPWPRLLLLDRKGGCDACLQGNGQPRHHLRPARGGWGGRVVLINVFTVAPEDADRFVAAWAEDAAYLKRQPGFIATQLHRGIAGSTVFLN